MSVPFPYNFFLYFLEAQKHEDSKLGIMINVGKYRLVKVIFSNIHKIIDALQTVLVDTSQLHNVWKMFLLFITFKFPGKTVFPGKLKLIYPSTSKHYNNCSAPTFLISFKNFLAQPHLKKTAETMHSISENTM